jgi:hypothetical protein
MDSYYTDNNLSYRSNSHTPLYILDLGEEKDKAPEKTTNNIFSNLNTIQDILILEAKNISNKNSDNKEILV